MVIQTVLTPAGPIPDEGVMSRPIPEERDYSNLSLSQVFELLTQQVSKKSTC